jgi:hypothetical protein
MLFRQMDLIVIGYLYNRQGLYMHNTVCTLSEFGSFLRLVSLPECEVLPMLLSRTYLTYCKQICI